MAEIADNTPWAGYLCVPTRCVLTVMIMSMAIRRASANTVPATLYPVAKLGRVAKFGKGNSKPASSSSSQAVPGTSRPQSTDTSNTADEVHTAFNYALTRLSSLRTTDSTSVATSSPSTSRSSPEMQSGGAQQAGSAYAQVDQQAGQTLDITA